MVTVKLNFKTEEEKRLFMSQLSDGWGESYCSLDWDYNTREFDDCNEFNVLWVYDPRAELDEYYDDSDNTKVDF